MNSHEFLAKLDSLRTESAIRHKDISNAKNYFSSLQAEISSQEALLERSRIKLVEASAATQMAEAKLQGLQDRIVSATKQKRELESMMSIIEEIIKISTFTENLPSAPLTDVSPSTHHINCWLSVPRNQMKLRQTEEQVKDLIQSEETTLLHIPVNILSFWKANRSSITLD